METFWTMQRKLYDSPAERQRAYRQRLKARLAGQEASSSRPKRKPTRPQRLADVQGQLEALANEYQHWLDAMPANQEDGDLADRLHETIALLQEALEVVAQVDPPRGFGR